MKERAKQFAKEAHHGQQRKVSYNPYITHPIRVAETLERAGCSEEVVCAGYLHDVVEDTPYDLEDIKKHFGPRVATLVAANTENQSQSWEERKQHTIDTVKTAEKDVKCLIIADKIDNLLSIETHYNQLGEAVWEHFAVGYDCQKWYYTSIANNMYSGLHADEVPTFFREYEEVTKRMFE
ncbi:MAG TPA: HD domain-containing protein [Bacillota bacterium]|nr:HD domain-containing protein [Bacillota bacterium]